MFSKFGYIASILLYFTTLQLFIPITEQRDPRLTSLAPLASKIGSISGLSSGGAKAFQFYLSHSSKLRGVGIFAGLMYECGLGATLNLEATKLYQCTNAGFNYTKVKNKIRELAHAGLFDPLKNLKSRRHFIFHGTNDNVVGVEEGDHMAKFFTEFGTSQNVFYNRSDATHSWVVELYTASLYDGIGFELQKSIYAHFEAKIKPNNTAVAVVFSTSCSHFLQPTLNCGSPCSRKFPPSSHGCLSCGWSGAFEVLNYIYNGTLKLPKNTTVNQCEPGDKEFAGLFKFDQREFFPPRSERIITMGDTGYIYIPPRCLVNSSLCTLHIHLHGCALQASSPLHGTTYMKCSGFLGVAEANDIIILFPQGTGGISSSISKVLQCWDFVGYTDNNYGTKLGLQVKTIKNMFDRIMGTNLPAKQRTR